MVDLLLLRLFLGISISEFYLEGPTQVICSFGIDSETGKQGVQRDGDVALIFVGQGLGLPLRADVVSVNGRLQIFLLAAGSGSHSFYSYLVQVCREIRILFPRPLSNILDPRVLTP